MNEKDCIMKGYDIEATNALLSNGMAEDIDDDVSSINLKKEESFVHMTDENTYNPLVTAGSLKVNDVVYDEATNHRLRVIDVKGGSNSWTKTITWKDLEDNRIFTTNPGVNALYELKVDGDMEFEVDDDIELEFHPIDTYFENFTEDMDSVTNEEIRLDIVNNAIDALHDMGYDDDFIGSYVHIEVKDTEDGRVKVEVRGEFNYEELSELSDRLNKVVSKYDKYAYFDMEDSGIASAYILKDQSDYVVNEEVVKAVSELIDSCETREDLKKVYIEHIRPFAENDVINTATFDAILNIFDKKLDVLVDDETVNEELEETGEDGWGDEVEETLEDVLDKMDRISYEVKRSRRGAYVDGDTVEDLVDELKVVDDMLTDAIDELEDNAERINESTLNEGPGAGYTIKSSGYDVNGEVIDVRYSEVEDEHYTNCKLDCKVNLTGKVQKFNAEAAYTGTGNVQYLPIVCHHIYIEAPKGTLEDWKVINSNNEIDKTALLDLIIDDLRDASCSFTYGGGWSHATYDGQLTDDEWLDGTYYCDVKASIYLSNEEDIKKVDRMTQGYGYEVWYATFDEDGDEVDIVEDKDEAIEYAKKNNYSRVVRVITTTDWNGDEDADYDSTVWENEEVEAMDEKLNTSTKTFSQWFDETSPKGNDEFYPFSNYVKTFESAEVLKDATAMDIVKNAHKFYDVYPVDSADREKAFRFASNELGLAYNDLYDAWVFETPIKLDKNESIKKDLKESDEEIPYTKEEVERDLKSITHDFTDKEGEVKCGFEEEKNFGVDILKQHYNVVEVSEDKRGNTTWYHISFAEPIMNESKSIKEELFPDAKREALADHLNVDVEDVVQTYDENNFEVQSTGEEYVVADYDTAYELAEEEVRNIYDDLGINSFTPYFQEWIMDYAVDEDWFKDALAESQRYYYEDMGEDEFIEECKENNISPDNEYAIDELVDAYLGGINDYTVEFRSIYGDTEFSTIVKENDLVDLDKVIKEAIRLDGIAHFIAHYDGEEIELNNDLFAYRTN